MRRCIKINGMFIPYARWFYHNFIAPIPEGYHVYHLDFDSINDEPDNLALNKGGRFGKDDYDKAIGLLNKRLNKLQRVNTDNIVGADKRNEHNKEIFRIVRLIEKVSIKVSKVKDKKVKEGIRV